MVDASLRWRFLKFVVDDFVSKFGWMVEMVNFFELIGAPIEDEINKILSSENFPAPGSFKRVRESGKL
jgi:hypothetical protein